MTQYVELNDKVLKLMMQIKHIKYNQLLLMMNHNINLKNMKGKNKKN